MQASASSTAGDASATFRAAGVVCLLTDFGHEDTYVGAMHAVISSCDPQLRVIDLSHGVAPQHVMQAGWYLANSFEYCPLGSVHVAVVDPGVGSERRILVAQWRGHAFLAPDNGLLGYVLGEAAVVRALDVSRYALPLSSRTFHGRDVFSPAAAALAAGADFEEFGERVEDWQRASFPAVETTEGGELRTSVLYADRFGNLITALRAEQLQDAEDWTVEVAGCELPLVATYADVSSGQGLALFGSSATLEVSVRDGHAARELGAGEGTLIRLRRRVR